MFFVIRGLPFVRLWLVPFQNPQLATARSSRLVGSLESVSHAPQPYLESLHDLGAICDADAPDASKHQSPIDSGQLVTPQKRGGRSHVTNHSSQPALAGHACLQNRLNELGQNYAIEIRSW